MGHTIEESSVIGSAIVLAASVTFAGAQPQLAAAGSAVFVVFGRPDSIQVARSTDAAETFGPPVALPVSGKMALGRRRGPRVAATRQAVLVSAVIGQRGGGADGDVLLYRSTDLGRSWSIPLAINDVPGAAREGMHAMAASEAGTVVIAWLDLRERGTRVYAAVSRDHGATWARNQLVYTSPSGSVCECCHPSAAVGDRGEIAVMFRNNIDGHRDMFVAESRDGRSFAPAVKLGTGSWALAACPMDGGALTLARGRAAVWRREGDVFLSDGASPERRLGSGRDPVIAAFGAERAIAWNDSASVWLRRSAGEPIAVGPGAYPAIVALADRTVVATESQGSVSIRAIARTSG
jgi:hypothetical protein